MKKFWPDNSYELYNKACIMSNYPEIPFGKFLKGIITQEDTVADIGCGFGIPSLYLSSLCKKVIAIDQDDYALKKLSEQVVNQGISNIELICGIWPNIAIEPCDISIALYNNKFASTKEELDKLLSITKKAGVITWQNPIADPSFHQSLSQKLGIELKRHSCDNGCYLKGRLDQADCNVTCERIAHDFGQPVADLDEASRFLCWQLKLEERYLEKISLHTKDYVIEKDGQMYIPLQRNNCVLTFTKLNKKMPNSGPISKMRDAEMAYDWRGPPTSPSSTNKCTSCDPIV